MWHVMILIKIHPYFLWRGGNPWSSCQSLTDFFHLHRDFYIDNDNKDDINDDAFDIDDDSSLLYSER